MDYLELINCFELRPLKTETHRIEAVCIMLELGRKGDENLSDDEVDYMSVLAMLIKSCEQQKIESESVSSAEALRYLLEVNKLRRSDIKHLISEEHSSSVLSTRRATPRKISKTEAARLAAYFKVSPQLFLERVNRSFDK
jgi:antitoxin component HigA of HigAB toxin-antitoxin module